MNTRNKWLFLIGALTIIYILEIFVVHQSITSQMSGANDFYSRWAGARALLIEGRNPYGLDVAYEIQEVINISHDEVGRGGFNYPLHVIFLFFPLIFVSYPWTQAIWMVTVQWMALGFGFVLAKKHDWRFSPLGLGLFVLGVISFYPITRTIFLGQFTAHVTLFLAVALLALDKKYDFGAGAILSLASVKPQLVLLVTPWLLLWSFSQRRWRFLGGLAAGGAILLGSSLLFYPNWVAEFIADTQRYVVFAGGRNPSEMVVNSLFSGGSTVVLRLLQGGILAGMLRAWYRGWGKTGFAFDHAVHWSIIANILVFFQTGTTNFLLLAVPIFAWLTFAKQQWGKWVTWGIAVTFSIFLWVLFLSTIAGNEENPILFLPLPWLCFAILVGIDLVQSRRSN